MKFDFKNNFGGGETFKFENVGHVAVKIWNRIHVILFFVLLIISVAFGWSIWIGSVMGRGWSEQKKLEFLNAQNTGVTFKEKEFNKVVEGVRLRNDENNAPYEPINDIFRKY